MPFSIKRLMPGRTMSRAGSWLGAAALALVYWLMAASSVTEKSSTFDEGLHLATGYSYWLFNDYRLQPENGNLPQRWCALPLALNRKTYDFPPTDDYNFRDARQWDVAHQMFYAVGNDHEQMLLVGRLMNALVGAAVVILVFVWSRHLFGPGGALLSATLAAFCPNLLAHGRLVTSDMFMTLSLTACVGALWLVMHRLTLATLAVSCVAATTLFLSKFSAVMIGPIGVLMLIVRLLGRRPLRVTLLRRSWRINSSSKQAAVLLLILAIHGGATWAGIWAAYGFRYSGFHPDLAQDATFSSPWEEVLEEQSLRVKAVSFAREHHLLPEAYLYGFSYVLRHASGRAAFMNGEYSGTGWRTFFIYCVSVKSPLGLFAILFLGLWALSEINRRGPTASADEYLSRPVARWLYEISPLAIMFGVYWALAVTSKLNIGLRHVLPTYPAAFIFCGAAAYFLRRRTFWRGALTAVAIGAVIVASVRIWPNYLTFFNSFIGPSNGYHHLVDSSLDWGQDLNALKQFLDENELTNSTDPPVFLAYFGTADPVHHGIPLGAVVRPLSGYIRWDRFHSFPVHPLEGGVYCISATMFQCVYTDFPRPWRTIDEQRYQARRRIVEPVFNSTSPQERLNQQINTEFFRLAYKEYEDARLARLCAYLRATNRPPDHLINNTILIFRLSDEDIREALEGEPKELVPTF